MNYFLPFFRLAPVQCSSWGWPITSGSSRVDYFLSSRHLEPAEGDSHYSERLVRLPHLPNYYRRPKSVAPGDRERFGISPAERVYLCPQNLRKFHPDFDSLLGEILRRDEHGSLLVLEGSRPSLTAALRARWQITLGDVAGRIRFIPRMVQADYWRLLSSVDAALDTIHYGGGANSTSDALIAAAPVVTLAGEFHRGRYAAAAYRIMGSERCVARSPAEYVELALRLGGDHDFRRQAAGEIAQTRDVLFDNARGTAETEEFFAAAIAAARQGERLDLAARGWD